MTLLQRLAFWFGLVDDLPSRKAQIAANIEDIQRRIAAGEQMHPPRAGRVPPRRAQRRPVRWPVSDCSDV